MGTPQRIDLGFEMDVPSESNPADIPSRFHEMTAVQREDAAAELGDLVELVLPAFASDDGAWLSSKAIAESVWR